MLLDIKKLFTKGTTLGRFEYIKLAWGLLLFPYLIIQIAIMIPPNNLLYYPVAALAIITLLAYLIIFWTAIFKRFSNIFEKTIISVILFIVFILSGIFKPLRILFNIILIVIPGKKKSDCVVSNKLFWITFPLVILLFISLRTLGINRWIPSEAMANTLQVNDRIIINIYDKDYHRGDIIVHKTDKKGVVYVKRIVALPGEKVEIRTLENGAKHIYINAKLLEEPYVKSVYDYPECSSQMQCGPIIVPENNYYVLGDNRGNSFDSRYYGTIDNSDIKGKVSHIWYPFNRRQVLETPEYSFHEAMNSKTQQDILINDATTYMNYMQKTIKANWNPPKFDNSMTTTVSFTIMKDGTITNAKIKTSSGNNEMDNAAITTVKNVVKLQPLPSEITKQHHKTDVEFTFTYNAKDSK